MDVADEQDARAAHRDRTRPGSTWSRTSRSGCEDGSGFLWYTERNGGPEVELRNADGGLARSLVKPDAGFRSLARYVEKERTLYFNGGPNPTESYLWRVKDGGAPSGWCGQHRRAGTSRGHASPRTGRRARHQHSRRPCRAPTWCAWTTAVGELPSGDAEPRRFAHRRRVPPGGPAELPVLARPPARLQARPEAARHRRGVRRAPPSPSCSKALAPTCSTSGWRTRASSS